MATKAYTPYRILKYAIGAMLVFAFVARVWLFVCTFLLETPINGWQFSEFLINYEGGFVRRGIIGEGLISMLRGGISGETMINLIRTVSIGCYVAVLAFFLYQFHQRRWNWWIILTPVFMGFVMCIIRKDFMQELLLIGMLMLLHGSPQRKGSLTIWCATILCAMELLIHEAFTFWGVPITILLIASSPASRWEKASSIAVIAGVIALLGICKGNEDTARIITNSWQSWFPGLEYEYWNSIGAIGWNPGWAAQFHLTANFCSPTIGWMRLPLQIAAFLCYSYMVCNFVYTFAPCGSTRDTQRKQLTAVYILTGITMIPMFTVLSVDYSRLYQYLTVTSFATVLIIPATRLDQALPKMLQSLTDRIIRFTDRYFTPSKGLMVALLLLADINGVHDLNDIAVGTLSSLYHGILLLVNMIMG